MCDACCDEPEKTDELAGVRFSMGGYDCTFVDPVPDQLMCTICLLVLRDPHLLSCCGTKVCQKCIEPIKLIPNSACPHCREKFDTMLEKSLQRQILSLPVYCTNKDIGCAWTGEMRSLDCHIEDKCIYTVVSCKYNCTTSLQRWQMAIHEQDECLARPIELKMQRLVEKMEDRLMSLEKENDDQRELIKKLQDQLDRQGLNETKLEEELEKEKARHCEAIEKLKEELKEEREGLLDRVRVEVKAEKVGIARQLDLLKNLVTDDLQPAIQTVHTSNRNMAASMSDWPVPKWQIPLPLVYSAQVPPCQYIMSSFSGHKSSRTSWFSPPFYSWPGGYKLSLCLSAKGYTDGKSDYMSASMQLVQGDFDEALPWPINCKVTVKLLNWRSDQSHIEQVIPIHANRCSGFPKTKTMTPDTTRKSITVTQRSVESIGDGQIVFKFASITRLVHNPITQTEYLHNDCLCVRIERVCTIDS